MKKIISSFFVFLLLTCNSFAKDTLRLIHVADLEALMQAPNTKLEILDANNEATRKKDGVIPGSKLLSSSKHFDTAAELPKDKNLKLVFYCANTKCTASHEAAKKAMRSGYTDVSVLADGIQGWAKAGKPVEKP